MEAFATRSAGVGVPLRELDVDRCLTLLATRRVGRLAIDDGRGPVVLPVNYLFHKGAVLVRTGPGTKLDAADRPAPVAFEVDEVDEDNGTGWSVVVRGRLVEMTDPDELDAILATAPPPFAAGPREHVVQLFPTAMSGRLLAVQAAVPPHGRHVQGNTWFGQDGDDLLA